jgi:hypothetical protein
MTTNSNDFELREAPETQLSMLGKIWQDRMGQIGLLMTVSVFAISINCGGS